MKQYDVETTVTYKTWVRVDGCLLYTSDAADDP